MPSHLDVAPQSRARIRGLAESGLLELAGALFHHRPEIKHPDWVVSWANEECRLAAHRRLLIDSTSPQALVVYTHETFPLWGQIIRHGVSGYRRQDAWRDYRTGSPWFSHLHRS